MTQRPDFLKIVSDCSIKPESGGCLFVCLFVYLFVFIIQMSGFSFDCLRHVFQKASTMPASALHKEPGCLPSTEAPLF